MSQQILKLGNERPQLFFTHIEGLRALAVFAVVLFHAEFFIGEQIFFKAGYLGVDMFFVISGYLIVGQLSRIDGHRPRIFLLFLTKRILRILPTVFCMVIFTLPFIWLVSAPPDFLFLTKVAEQVVFFKSNIFFAADSNYWASLRLFQPYLHTWSLSVELQFYLLVGLVLIFLVPRKWGRVFLWCALIVTSTFAILSNSDEQAKFYLIEFRIWEFLFGGILNFIVIKKNNL